MSKKFKKLEIVYIPYKCLAINFKHYELCYKVGKKTYNLFCLHEAAQGREGVNLLRKMVKHYQEKDK